MKAKVLDKSDEAKWEKFLKTQPLSTIHQSPAWGHFQAKIPYRGKYWIITLEEDGKIIGGTMLIKQKIRKKYSWLYAARGPLLSDLSQIQKLMPEIKKIAKKEDAIFLRIDPSLTEEIDPIQGFKKIKEGFQPQHTLILDLEKDEEELLKEMKPKGRYNIKLATKKGVKISVADPKKVKDFQKELNDFFKVLEETTKRDGFRGHNKNYYKNMLETLPENAKLYLARFNGELLAATIVTFFKDTATYYYGASSNKNRNVMAPYLLQWQAIQDSKKMGLKTYDFLGISPDNNKDHPWYGVTEFKLKFGGEKIDYASPQEYSFKKLLHILYKLIKK